MDKRKKLEEEAAIKAVEAEANYRSCVDEANDRHRYRYFPAPPSPVSYLSFTVHVSVLSSLNSKKEIITMPLIDLLFTKNRLF